MHFPEKLLTLRKANNLTQEQLAEKLEVSRQSVSKWESGQAVPELEKIITLSAIFDVTTDYLLKSSEIDDLSVKTELEKEKHSCILPGEMGFNISLPTLQSECAICKKMSDTVMLYVISPSKEYGRIQYICRHCALGVI